jgi:hypothetical protein
MNVVGAGDKWPKGVVFGLKSLEFEEGQLFPIMEHDWEYVSSTVTPLVDNLITKMGL